MLVPLDEDLQMRRPKGSYLKLTVPPVPGSRLSSRRPVHCRMLALLRAGAYLALKGTCDVSIVVDVYPCLSSRSLTAFWSSKTCVATRFPGLVNLSPLYALVSLFLSTSTHLSHSRVGVKRCAVSRHYVSSSNTIASLR
jgi:hypothetical protein